MFARAALQSWCLALLLCVLLVHAAPTHPAHRRQIGNLQCNLDRGAIVADILKMQSTVKNLASQVSSDPTNSAAVSAAQGGINQALGGIENIAVSILTGKAASATDRDTVISGLNTVESGLNNITSTDPTITSNVAKALSQLQSAGAAGDGVLANCK